MSFIITVFVFCLICSVLFFVYHAIKYVWNSLWNLIYAGLLLTLRLRLGSRRQSCVQVECWFCQAVTSVPAGNRSCFDCPECDQYNGFTADGGYNKAIPAQYNEELNQAFSRAKLPEHHFLDKGQGVLCDICQTNQELKIQQLAAFVPTRERNFDAEVTEYAQYLEEAYRLCPACASEVYSELNRQDADIKSKLLGQRLSQTVQINVTLPCAQSRMVPILRTLCLLAAFVIIFAELSSVIIAVHGEEERSLLSQGVVLFAELQNTVALCGFVLCVLSSLMAGKYRLTYLDCACPLVWILYMGNNNVFPVWRWLSSSPPEVAPPSPSAGCLLLQRVWPWLSVDICPLLLSSLLLATCLQHAKRATGALDQQVFSNSPNRLTKTARETPPHRASTERDKTVGSVPSVCSDRDSVTSSRSSQEEESEMKRLLLDQHIGGLSLGPPLRMPPKNKDVWTAHTPPTSRPTTPLSHERPSSREFRPIILPATFNPPGMKRSDSQSSFASSFCGCVGPLPLRLEPRSPHPVEPLTESGRGSSIRSSVDDSSDGSFPVGTSAEKKGTLLPSVKHSTLPQGWTSFLLPCILGFSLGINFAVVVYFLCGR